MVLIIMDGVIPGKIKQYIENDESLASVFQ